MRRVLVTEHMTSARQEAQQGTSPGSECHYLVCHGEVREDTIATLAGTTVGVYTAIGNPLEWQDARNILRQGLDPIYRPRQGDFLEYQLFALSPYERAMWEKFEDVLYGDPDIEFLDSDQALSAYLAEFAQSKGGQELRLLACASLSKPTGQPRKLLERPTWGAAAIVSKTNGALFDLRIAENKQEKVLLGACARSWDEARAFLAVTDANLISAFALKGGPSMLAVKAWLAWEKKPEQPHRFTDWLAFLEVLTPDEEAAEDLYQTWRRARQDPGSLTTALGEVCTAIDQMLAAAEQRDKIYEDNPCAKAFRNSGWAESTADLDLADEITAGLRDDDTGPVPPESTEPGEEGKGMKRRADVSSENLKAQPPEPQDKSDDE